MIEAIQKREIKIRGGSVTALLSSLAVLFLANVPAGFCLGIAFPDLALPAPGLFHGYGFSSDVQRPGFLSLLAILSFFHAGRTVMSFRRNHAAARGIIRSLGWNLRGGLAHITIVASMFFAGITGSGAAEAAAIGSLMIPSMVDEGYDIKFAVSVVTCSSFIGVIIPPSIPMIIYGGLRTEVPSGPAARGDHPRAPSGIFADDCRRRHFSEARVRRHGKFSLPHTLLQ